MNLRWGFLGASWVATTAMAPAVHASKSAILQSVASRDLNRAAALEPVKAYGSYADLLADPNVDAVYISLANHLHHEWSIKALQAGKHVLCEKPLALSRAQAQAMFDCATANDRLLVEAIWFRWHPRFRRLVEITKNGDLGELLSIDSAFTFSQSFIGNYRLSPQMGGGSLMDVAPYQLHTWVALSDAAAKFEIISLTKDMGPTGVDLSTEIDAAIDKHLAVRAVTSFKEKEEQRLIITGQMGEIQFSGNQAFTSWNCASALLIGDFEEVFAPVDPFLSMIESFAARLHGHESWLPDINDSLRVMEMIDQVNKF